MTLKELFEAGHILNLTPHSVTLLRGDGETETLPSNGSVRLVEEVREVPDWPFPLVRKTFDGVEISLGDLPSEIKRLAAFNLDGGGEDGHILIVIVSFPVAQALRNDDLRHEFVRKLGDLLGVPSGASGRDLDCHLVITVPDTGPKSVVRDSEGHILGVRRFCVLR